MWDMITSMATDRLWIYTGIAGSLFGAAFLFYIKDTRAGLWCYSKFDKSIDFFRDRYGWTWLNQDKDAWKKVHPRIAIMIEMLELQNSDQYKKIVKLQKELVTVQKLLVSVNNKWNNQELEIDDTVIEEKINNLDERIKQLEPKLVK